MNYPKTPKRKVLVEFTDKEIEMMSQLKEAMLITHRSQLVRTAVYELYQKVFKPYIQKKAFMSAIGSIPNSRGIIGEDIIIGESICRRLEGKVIKDEDGVQMCEYTTYSKGGQNIFTGTNAIPLEDLDEHHVENQYKGGTKHEIKELMAKQKENEQRGLEDLGIEPPTE